MCSSVGAPAERHGLVRRRAVVARRCKVSGRPRRERRRTLHRRCSCVAIPRSAHAAWCTWGPCCGRPSGLTCFRGQPSGHGRERATRGLQRKPPRAPQVASSAVFASRAGRGPEESDVGEFPVEPHAQLFLFCEAGECPKTRSAFNTSGRLRPNRGTPACFRRRSAKSLRS